MCQEKVAGLQAYSWQLHKQMNYFIGIFSGYNLDFKKTVTSHPHITHTNTLSKLTHPYHYIFTPPVMCPQ